MTPSMPSAIYFIVEGNGHAGPFTLEQLVEKKITENSLVWSVGMDNWAVASSIPALRPLFKTAQKAPATHVVSEIPSNKKNIQHPDIEQPVTVNFEGDTVGKGQSNQPSHKPLFSLKETLFDSRWKKITYSAIALFIIIGMLQIGRTIKKSNLEERNRLTEEHNLKMEQEQKALLLKEAAQKEQELKDQKRRELEVKESINRRISEIEVEIAMQKEELVLARQKFSEATAPQLFRSPEKRNEDVSAAMDLIKYHEEEIERLQKEIKIVELNGKRAIEGRNF